MYDFLLVFASEVTLIFFQSPCSVLLIEWHTLGQATFNCPGTRPDHMGARYIDTELSSFWVFSTRKQVGCRNTTSVKEV